MLQPPRTAFTAAAALCIHAAAAAQQPIWSPILGVAAHAPGVSQVTYDLRRHRLVAVSIASVAEHDRAAWRLAGPGHPLLNTATAYDAARHLTVSFGGSALFFADAGTRAWDGTSWTVLAPPTSPPARHRAAMAFDRLRSRLVLFGGLDAVNVPLADTWEYDGFTWTRMPTASAPPPRGAHALTFDVARGVTVLFGGSGATTFSDTWEWDGSTWTQHGSGPAALPNVLAYDEVRARTVLVVLVNGLQQTQTWERIGTSWTLQQLAGPLYNVVSGGVFDPVLGRVVTTGTDRNASGPLLLWSWHGATWSPVTPHDAPLLLDGAAAAHCPLRQSRLLFGTSQGALVGTDVTWEWRGGVWRLVPTTNRPPLLSDPAMATEPGGTVLLFGGAGPGAQNATWRFTGTDWQLLQPANAPSPRSQHGMAFDPLRNRIVLFGGVDSAGSRLGDTWEWDGGNWLAMTPATSPPLRANPAMGFDPVSARVLLFGGGQRYQGQVGDCWGWDGTTWQPLPGGPTSRGRAQMDFDPVRQRTVLAGGFAPQLLGFFGAPGSYEWDGSSWTTISATWPSPALGATGGFDPALSRFVLFGTSAGNLELGAPSLAAAIPFGAPCSGGSGDPRLETPWVPRAGNPFFGVRAVSLLPGAPALLGVGTSPAAIALGGGCTLLVGAPLLLSSLADAAGVATFALPLPAVPAVHGASFACQGAGLDPAGAFADIAVFSNGLQLTLD